MENEQSNKNEQDAGLDAWNKFLVGDFLKEDLVRDSEESFLVLTQETHVEDNREVLRLQLQKEGMTKTLKFDLNKTNIKFVKDKKFTPDQLVGKKLYFNKVDTQNPKGEAVIGLRISKVE